MKKRLIKKILQMTFYLFWVLRIACVPLLLATSIAWASGQSLSTVKVTLKAENITLDQVLEMIEDKTNFDFYYATRQMPLSQRITIVAQKESLRKVLSEIAKQAHVDFRRIEKRIYVQKSEVKQTIAPVSIEQEPEETISSNDKQINGIVKDGESGNPLIGATVQVKNTTIGMITDVNGSFQLSVPDNAKILIVSFVGYVSQEITIGNQTNFDITLEVDNASLEEIVVVGYGTQEKSDVTGSVSGIKEETFNGGIMTSAEQLFQGKLSGVRVVNSSGEPGAGIDVFIRGAGSVRSGNTPLFVVDGVPLNNGSTSAGGQDVGFGSSSPQNPLNFLNPSDIESIDVLKDASAAAIYGARGSNGVIIITTKKAKENRNLLSYDSYFGISNVSNKLDVLSGSEYAAANPNGVFDTSVDTDWQDEIFRTATTHYHNLSLGRVLGKSSYQISLSYLDQQGIIENSGLERIGARLNTSTSFFENDRLQLNFNVFISETDTKGVPTSDGAGSGGELITNALRANPTFPVRETNGDFFAFPSGSNPIALLDVFSDETTTTRLLTNLEATLKLVGNLQYKFNIGLDRSVSERNTTVNQTNLFDVIAEPNGFYGQNNNENSNVLIENLLTYDIEASDFNVKLLLGHAYQKFNVSGTAFSVSNFSTSEIDPANNPNIGTNINPPTGFAQENELQSFFFRTNFGLSGQISFHSFFACGWFNTIW